jgi:acyl-CoA dehydrogenase
MDFHFSEDALILQEMLRRFIEKEARPLEMKFFLSGSLEEKERLHLRKVIEQMGLWGILLPEEFGGGGLDLVTSCVVEEELGKTFIPLELGDAPLLLFACHDEQVARYLDPVLSGERRAILVVREPDSLRPEQWVTTASPEDGGFVINGIKLLSEEPVGADFLVLLARTSAGVSAFLLENDQKGLHYAAGKQIQLLLKDCKVGGEALLGVYDQALSLDLRQVQGSLVRVGARFIGLAERMLAMAAEYANTWVALGAPLKNRPAVQHMLAEVYVQIEAARWLVYHTAWLADQGEPLKLPAAGLRLVTGQMLQKVKELVTMIYGGPSSISLDLRRVFSQPMVASALDFGLESPRILIANEILASHQEGSV